jgi:hypothetical protein
MVPEPSRTNANEHHPTVLTCSISKTRRSAIDRNDLDTVEVIHRQEVAVYQQLPDMGMQPRSPSHGCYR